MDTVKLYLKSMAMLLRGQMQYPLSFLLRTLSQLVMEIGELMALVLLIDRFDHLNQWTGADLLFFFGMISVAFYLTECFGRGVTNFSPLVRSGELDTFLLRPRGVLTQVLCAAVDPRRLGAIAIGVAALLLSQAQAPVHWTALKILAFAEAIGFGFVMILGLFLIEAVLCIRSVKSIEMVNALTYGGRSACQYPIDVYPLALRAIFLLIAPFGMVIHAPAAYILEKPLFGWPTWTAFVCPLMGGVCFGAMYALFRFALRYYRSTGS